MNTDDDLDDCYLDEESLVIAPDDEWDNVGLIEKTRYWILLAEIMVDIAGHYRGDTWLALVTVMSAVNNRFNWRLAESFCL